MSKEGKLKKLFRLWPLHTALPVAFLKKNGFSQTLIQKYVSSGWMSYFDRGVVVRPEDIVLWPGLVWGGQQICDLHVGGKTALELEGKAHYIKYQEKEISLFCEQGLKLPHWLLKESLNPKFVPFKTSLLPNNIGISEFDFGEFRLRISNPARAFVEYIYELSKTDAYDEAYYLMENLKFISPQLFQEVLEGCRSIKIKRLVLCLAKKTRANWLEDIDLAKIELGSGPREAVLKGRYDPEYQITYPREWDKNEDEVIF